MLERVKKLIKSTWNKASKKLAILIALIIFTVIGFCFINEWTAIKSESCWDVQTKPYAVIEKNYEIYEVGYPGGPYQYYIFDNKHKMLDHGTTNGIPPKITINHGLVKTYDKFGTDSFVYQYYEPEKGLRSDYFFMNIINDSDTMIIYLDGAVGNQSLIVHDIFDKSKYYRVFYLDFSNVPNPVIQADFINGGRQLEITYKAGKDEREVTETLDLY